MYIYILFFASRGCRHFLSSSDCGFETFINIYVSLFEFDSAVFGSFHNMEPYYLFFLAGTAVFIIACVIVAFVLRLLSRRKREEEEGAVGSVAYPYVVHSREGHEPLSSTAEPHGNTYPRGYYFRFQPLDTHANRRQSGHDSEDEDVRPIMGADAQGIRIYRREPCEGTLVLDDGDGSGYGAAASHTRSREPIYYGEAVYMSRPGSSVPPAARVEKQD
ncbi:hypothetical protein ABB37_05899 [Leptomonas pyrrhocoris]|uniref:Transmembrane protein n=1 Tax=Leptomonas pyrrhocoris TaxID=157538 RepID=A0A0N0VET2_LEPPY|nr:hypothetical protein ABB37_05899 [Leptomonas pyrrhocoris]XP_015657240.1 hypothetical protein ABB37_05899 [Leptomonas pyrrhocoris]KPA78800.1 hypothetical protein ABB37_05899 [Leptomonas pyrrhocoris]KPA78801.1 hypothetical protein ABB37_05899 [Leptomonas pyrrhocoris]|eukprot:XP_015657239.1 hypothetical protein ABB37_05899 [Leptomonas pyrrhocoris]